MSNREYRFSFSLFGKKVQMFTSGGMGVVVEKEPQVVCVYGTDATHSQILCAIPLCSPKMLKGKEFVVSFPTPDHATVRVENIKVVIDFAGKKCSNNAGVKNYGSETWGDDVSAPWNADLDGLF